LLTDASLDGFPADIRVAAQGIDAPELEALARRAGIVPLGAEFPLPRRREFLAGRLAAQAALARLGERGLVGRRGHAPVWPPGFCGSISHSGGFAVAVAASTRRWRALGVDLEAAPAPGVVPTLRRAFAAAEWQACGESPDPGVWARAWAGKEAAWKCASACGLAPRLDQLVVDWEDAATGTLQLASADARLAMRMHAAPWRDMALVLAAIPA
jgi:4'-phosphopantetheinyl transferase EntD